jgi:hypothetical protein
MARSQISDPIAETARSQARRGKANYSTLYSNHLSLPIYNYLSSRRKKKKKSRPQFDESKGFLVRFPKESSSSSSSYQHHRHPSLLDSEVEALTFSFTQLAVVPHLAAASFHPCSSSEGDGSCRRAGGNSNNPYLSDLEEEEEEED